METFTYFLLKSVIWLSGFAAVYLLFLRNERFFLVNRYYLLAGVFASIFFPFISIHYTVLIPIVENTGMGDISVSRAEDAGSSGFIYFSFFLIMLYITGALFIAFKLFRQSRKVIKVIKKADSTALHSVKLIRTSEYPTSFSFFSYVFVNPSVTDIEIREIVNHEMAHIRQRHWFDLVLVELLCLLQWFNPVVWIYIRFIRQNHEYLADEVALQRTSDPAVYRAALLNQIVGAPVIILANSFNYSINKKRFNMMKNKISSPYRKMKLLLILPVIAVVLFSFAKPEYKYISTVENNDISGSVLSRIAKEVKGTIVSPEGKPLNGATVVLKGTTLGVTSDSKGVFQIANIPDDGLLIVSYVGFKSRAIKPLFDSDMTIKMERDTVSLRSIGVPPPPPPPPPADSKKEKVAFPAQPTSPSSGVIIGDFAPPPPPPPPPLPTSEVKIRNTDGSEAKPLVIIDGVIDEDFGSGHLDPNSISSVSVLKDKSSTDLYGETGRDGVILITTKRQTTKAVNENEDIKVIGYGQQLNSPPTIEGVKIRAVGSMNGGKPLITVNGVIRDIDLNGINPQDIESISVLKNESATKLYGDKAKDGLIAIELKPGVNSDDLNNLSLSKMESVKVTGYAVQKNTSVSDRDGFVVTEEMPTFPGGEKAIQSYIYSNIKVLKGSEKITEPVFVVFTVNSKGKVRDAQVLKKKYPTWEAEAIRVISHMPDWKPGSQNGKPIDVIMQLPIDFSIEKRK